MDCFPIFQKDDPEPVLFSFDPRPFLDSSVLLDLGLFRMTNHVFDPVILDPGTIRPGSGMEEIGGGFHGEIISEVGNFSTFLQGSKEKSGRATFFEKEF